MTFENRPKGVEGADALAGKRLRETLSIAQTRGGIEHQKGSAQRYARQQPFTAWRPEQQRAHVRQVLAPATMGRRISADEQAQQRRLARVNQQAAFIARAEAAAHEAKAALAWQADERAELLQTAASFSRFADALCLEVAR